MAERELEASGLEAVLNRIWRLRSFDFSSYKRGTLKRRIDRRMAELKVRGYEAYAARLERDPVEVDRLVSSMLIKLTSFFRDEALWSYVRSEVLPQLLQRRATQELRVWSAGCATGEEAYSLAFLLSDALGMDALGPQVKVFGTDVDEASIAFARRAVYSERQVQGLSPEQRSRWFSPAAEGYAVRKEIRRAVVFGVNDLVSDAPVSRIDLLLCRNVFIYLNTELQKRVLTRFRFALRPSGILVLGKSELIPFAAQAFQPVELSQRVYRRDRAADLPAAESPALPTAPRPPAEAQPRIALAGDKALRALIEAAPWPMIATDPEGVITLCNRAATRLWGRGEGELLGKSILTAGLSGVSGDSLAQKTVAVRTKTTEREWSDVRIERSGKAPQPMRLQLVPVASRSGELHGILYVAQDLSELRQVEADLQRVNEELRQTYERMSLTRDELRASNEELETTNEELQSANQELQTTNEELQSTNEELETTNEELQSTNAELDATNRELAHRTREMDVLMLYQQTIIRSLSAAVVVIDAEDRITTWNLAAERMLGLSEREVVGRPLWSLRIPALKRALLARLRRVVAQRQALRLEAVPYQLPTGTPGYVNLALTPLIEGRKLIGSVWVMEDTTRIAALAKENRELKSRRVASGRS